MVDCRLLFPTWYPWTAYAQKGTHNHSLRAEGYAQSNGFDSTSFLFEKHKTPVFHDYGNSRYRETLFAVEKTSNITYGRARGFWTEMPQEVPAIDKISQIGNAIIAAPLDLHLDIFRPKDDTLQKRPMIMFIQGGAFYFGSKEDKAPSRWCQYYASQGYVTVTIDYRIGFIPTRASAGRLIVPCRMPMPQCVSW